MNGLWFLTGALLGGLLLWMQALTVARLRPHTAPLKLALQVAAGAVLRWLAVAILLMFALRQSAVAGLWAFAGLWLARWPLIYLIHRRWLFARLLQ